jgi:hypothetical protein
MKRSFYLLSLLILSSLAFGQIPNASFETWNTVTMEKPQIWEPNGKVSKVSGGQQGNYAVKLETDLNNVISPVADIVLGSQAYGVPYNGNPDTMKIWIKYNIANADTATFHAELLSGGSLVRAGDYFLTVGSSNNWMEISFPMIPIDTSLTPDTLYFEINNTSFDNPQVASWLIVDNIRGYKKGVLQSAIPNFSFENWATTTSKVCPGWITTNEVLSSFGLDSVNVTQSTDAQAGSSAVMMRNIDFFGNYLPGGMVTGSDQNAAFAPDMTPTIAVTDRYSSLSGYFKFTKKATDEAEISAYMFSNGVKVGEGHFYRQLSQSTYLLFEAKIAYDPTFTGIPDSATIYMAATRDIQNVTGTSSLLVDNLTFNKWALGIKNTDEKYSVYPNPCREIINIRYAEQSANYLITGIDGKEVMSGTLDKGDNSLPVSGLKTGLYVLRVIENGNISTFKISKL